MFDVHYTVKGQKMHLSGKCDTSKCQWMHETILQDASNDYPFCLCVCVCVQIQWSWGHLENRFYANIIFCTHAQSRVEMLKHYADDLILSFRNDREWETCVCVRVSTTNDDKIIDRKMKRRSRTNCAAFCLSHVSPFTWLLMNWIFSWIRLHIPFCLDSFAARVYLLSIFIHTCINIFEIYVPYTMSFPVSNSTKFDRDTNN